MPLNFEFRGGRDDGEATAVVLIHITAVIRATVHADFGGQLLGSVFNGLFDFSGKD